MKSLLTCLVATLLALSVNACGSSQASDEQLPFEDITESIRGPFGFKFIGKKQILLIKSQGELEAFVADGPDGFPVQVPQIDFSQYRVLVISLGASLNLNNDWEFDSLERKSVANKNYLVATTKLRIQKGGCGGVGGSADGSVMFVKIEIPELLTIKEKVGDKGC